MNLSNFGEQFASSVLAKTYQRAVFEGIVNRNYEGEIRKPGDRINILSFLNAGELQDYTVGTDMSVQQMVDAEDQLVVEKRKAYNITLDRLEDLFTYASDIPEFLISEQARALEVTIDSYVLNKFGEEAKAGNWIGIDLVVEGSGQTMASIVTTATGGTVTLNATSNTYEGQVGSVENPRDGNTYHAGFESTDIYKGFRLRSTAAWVTPWYRISSVTDSVTAALTEWDEETSGPDFEEGYTLRGLFGGDGVNFTKYGSTGDASFLTMSSLGWEIQAAAPTSVTAGTIYDQVTLLAQALDENEVPAEDRKLTVTPAVITQLRQSTEMQPTGIAEIFSGTVINGRVMRVGAFDVHSAAGSRVSTRAQHSTSSTTGPGADLVLSSPTGHILAANHMDFMTYADKWSESRVVDSENQFAKKYQGLFLFGAKVPRYRRRHGAVLYASL